MSKLNRNVLTVREKHNLAPLYLPEIVTERDFPSPKSVPSGGDPLKRTASGVRDDKKLFINSTVSSAASRRFQDLFYRYERPLLSDTGAESSNYVEIESCGSSGSSMFSWADPDATLLVAEEWEKIERTLYDEPGQKVTKKHLIDECNQWKSLFPHLRIIGKKCDLNKANVEKLNDSEEEILPVQYDSDIDNSNFRLNQNKKLIKERINVSTNHKTYKRKQSTTDIIDELDKYLQISSIGNTLNYKRSPVADRTPSIIRSEMSSSRWKHKISSPDNVSFSYRNKFVNKGKINRTRESSVTSLSSLVSSKQTAIYNTNNFYQQHPTSNYIDKHKKSAHSMQSFEEQKVISKTLYLKSFSQERDTVENSAAKRKNISLPPLQRDETRKIHVESSNHITHRKIKDNINNVSLSPINSPKYSENLITCDSVVIQSVKKSRNRKKGYVKNNLSPL